MLTRCKNRMIISVVAAKIWYLKCTAFIGPPCIYTDDAIVITVLTKLFLISLETRKSAVPSVIQTLKSFQCWTGLTLKGLVLQQQMVVQRTVHTVTQLQQSNQRHNIKC